MAKTHEQYVEELKNINPSVRVLGRYTKAVERIKVECLLCQKVWEPKAYQLLQGQSCSHCSAVRGAKNNKSKTGLKSKERFVKELNELDNTIEIVGSYVNTHTKIECVCKRCRHEWKARPYSLLQGHGCPRCAKSGTSFMEQYIRLSYECAIGADKVISRSKEAIGMELDIYISELKLAIEPGNWYLHKKSLERDKDKRRLCEQQGIRLITIYDKFPKNEKVPFEKDCFVFEEDLNKADRAVLKELIYTLFKISSISYDFTDAEFNEIERNAYECARAKNSTEFLLQMRDLHPDIDILGIYQNSSKRIAVRCTVCNNEWDAVPANLLSGDGCKKCGTKKAHEKFIKDQKVFEEQVASTNSDIIILGKYRGRHSSIKAKCRVCGYEWEPIASSLLRGSNHKGWRGIHRNFEPI